MAFEDADFYGGEPCGIAPIPPQKCGRFTGHHDDT
jgi:hypothetical protein